MVTSLLTDKRLKSWLSGAVLTWSWTRSKQWRLSWTSGETPLLSRHSNIIMKSTVTSGESFSFLGITISQDLKWDNHIDLFVKKGQQKWYFLRRLLKKLYSVIIESILCTSIAVWFSSATKSDLRRQRSVVRTAERIIGTTLHTLQELYLSRVSKRVGKIILDPSHPAHFLFELLPSGRRYRARSTRTVRHRNSLNPSHEHLTIIMVHTLFIHLII